MLMLLHTPNRSGFVLAEGAELRGLAAEIEEQVVGEAVSGFGGAPEVGIAADAVELAARGVVSGEAVTGGESVEAEFVGAVAFFEPAAC